MRPLRIGTRGSPLALVQAHLVAARLGEGRGTASQIITMQTSGDRGEGYAADASVKGLFVKELEEALLRGDIDVAVHSAKDMSSVLPDGLVLVAALPREDASDALVLPRALSEVPFEEACQSLRVSARVGTGSARRASQLRAALPTVRFEDVRGNVDSRLRKLDAGLVDALVLATAGLVRLGMRHRVTCRIPHDVCVPSPGQGIIALQARDDAEDVGERLRAIGDAEAWVCLRAERAVVSRLGVGCRTPLGAIASVAGEVLTIRGALAVPGGPSVVRAAVQGAARDADALGTQLADALQASSGEAPY